MTLREQRTILTPMPTSKPGLRGPDGISPREPESQDRLTSLFLASLLALYFELLVIRYLSTEVRVFAYLKNLPLIASFLGIGLGMILGRVPPRLGRLFPVIAALLFALIGFAPLLGLTRIALWTGDYHIFGEFSLEGLSPWILAIRYLSMVLGVLVLVVAFFVVLGGLVGERLKRPEPLRGYAVNLAGSLAGIALFTAFSVLSQPPVLWLVVGFLLLVPFFWGQWRAVLLFAAAIFFAAYPQPDTYWSPYYRIQLHRLSQPAGWPSPSSYGLTVNHDYHQRMVDLSEEFVRRFPQEEPNRTARVTYELPYQLVREPGDVLVVGAGTGNDVAAALRHGARHVDAVEIDPVILELGRCYHPERPYADPRVTVWIEDARAFFKKSDRKYNLVVFGYLDSHTLLSSFSSLRLDNYVYTVESFQEARSLLREDGSLIVAFASERDFVTDNLYSGLTQAFGAPPKVYETGYDGGMAYVQGPARQATLPTDLPEISSVIGRRADPSMAPTDRWPFLYLIRRTVPWPILMVLLPFLCGAWILLRKTITLPWRSDRSNLHLLFLGAGFLLLETKAVTELSLLFGSTWVVNSVVIGAFLTMALLANFVVMKVPVPRRAGYAGLFLLLGAGFLFPYSQLNSAPFVAKVLGAGLLAGLPVFFSGLVFSRSFRDVLDPQRALGVNLFGAMVGGVLENLVMIGGVPLLGVLAILLYGLSAFFAPRSLTVKSS